jgi:predicted nucleic acid-binding protein
MKVFFDTNVLIDVVAKRQQFYIDSARIWTLAEEGKIDGLVSAISFTNIFYVVRKLKSQKVARQALSLLRLNFSIVACDEHVLSQAMDADIKDFEDAVQYLSAMSAGADCLASRNPSHFPTAPDCPVLTPTEFLAANSFE